MSSPRRALTRLSFPLASGSLARSLPAPPSGSSLRRRRRQQSPSSLCPLRGVWCLVENPLETLPSKVGWLSRSHRGRRRRRRQHRTRLAEPFCSWVEFPAGLRLASSLSFRSGRVSRPSTSRVQPQHGTARQGTRGKGGAERESPADPQRPGPPSPPREIHDLSLHALRAKNSPKELRRP